MNFKKYEPYQIEDFILDDNFSEWVKRPTTETDSFWEEFIICNPGKRQQIHESILILKSIQANEKKIPKHRLDSILQTAKIKAKPRHFIGFSIGIIAAIFFLMLTIGFMVYYINSNRNAFTYDLVFNESLGHGKIILPDGTEKEFDTEQTSIRSTASGNLTVNNDTLLLNKDLKEKFKQSLAQVIIPHGKRSVIDLADGSRIWLNAGSKLMYPVEFTGSSREVFLSGEAFFDVKEDPARPFYVSTNDVKIKVTGTQFNVMAYSDDYTTEAVLLEGKIEASKNRLLSRSIEVNPGEMIAFNRKENSVEKKEVNTELHSSWIKGYLLFKNEPIINIFTKLERYYDRKIYYEGFADHISITGKLNLNEDIETALNILRFSAPFDMTIQEEKIHLKLNN